MIKIDGKKIAFSDENEDVKIDKDFIGKDQFLEIATAKNVHLGSLECNGIRIIARNIYINGKVVSHSPIVLAGMKIFINTAVPST